MRDTWVARTMAVGLLSLCAAAGAGAQTASVPLPSRPITVDDFLLAPVLPEDSLGMRLAELRRWTREYGEWRAWFIRWHNRRERGWFGTRPRRQPPTPPVWLAGACATLIQDTGPMADGCEAWREWHRGDLTVLQAGQREQQRAALERPKKSIWWEHVHIDALWPMAQSGSSAFGVAGMHVTFPLTGRVQVFLAPGAILMRLPSRDGGRTWSAAADWGFSYRMFDFRMPGVRRASTLHLNIARVWVFGAISAPVGRELYLAGFSVSFGRTDPGEAP